MVKKESDTLAEAIKRRLAYDYSMKTTGRSTYENSHSNWGRDNRIIADAYLDLIPQSARERETLTNLTTLLKTLTEVEIPE